MEHCHQPTTYLLCSSPSPAVFASVARCPSSAWCSPPSVSSLLWRWPAPLCSDRMLLSDFYRVKHVSFRFILQPLSLPNFGFKPFLRLGYFALRMCTHVELRSNSKKDFNDLRNTFDPILCLRLSVRMHLYVCLCVCVCTVFGVSYWLSPWAAGPAVWGSLWCGQPQLPAVPASSRRECDPTSWPGVGSVLLGTWNQKTEPTSEKEPQVFTIQDTLETETFWNLGKQPQHKTQWEIENEK